MKKLTFNQSLGLSILGHVALFSLLMYSADDTPPITKPSTETIVTTVSLLPMSAPAAAAQEAAAAEPPPLPAPEPPKPKQEKKPEPIPAPPKPKVEKPLLEKPIKESPKESSPETKIDPNASPNTESTQNPNPVAGGKGNPDAENTEQGASGSGRGQSKEPEGGPVIGPSFNAGYLSNPQPPYPAASRENGEEGTVQLMVSVSEEGRALSVTVHKSSSYRRLDQAAVKAVQNWRFVPAKRGNTPIAGQVIVPIRFKLED